VGITQPARGLAALQPAVYELCGLRLGEQPGALMILLPHRTGGRAHPDPLVGTDTEAKGQSVPVSETGLDCKEAAGERCLGAKPNQVSG